MRYTIRDFRERIGMSQEELSARSGISRGTIVALESGKDRVATTQTLEKLARVLETSFASLISAECLIDKTEGGGFAVFCRDGSVVARTIPEDAMDDFLAFLRRFEEENNKKEE